ncbi:GyrI-like domain-containing protein [Leucobacter sp. M11]|uniref:GyrI-like domain-containing protein n=1 Tax=Leucobacter sp. M11 TaxID=2993565 RepID=UPI002D809CC2|nr:GyrI-like domain-containing protein [Leucobacter sp. M11]MEB4613528.1 GyrI-like domain-containing protein [Leucobacter sp. M11]
MPTLEPILVTLAPQHVAGIRRVVPMREIPQHYDASFPALGAAFAATGVTPSGPPMGISNSMPGDTLDLTVGFPVAEAFPGHGDVVDQLLPGGPAAEMMVLGDYAQLPDAYGTLLAWLAEQGLTPGPLAWEQYLTNPEPDADPAQNQTKLVWLLAE